MGASGPKREHWVRVGVGMIAGVGVGVGAGVSAGLRENTGAEECVSSGLMAGY